MNVKRKVIITGGGTGGHVFPAVAIAEELISRGIAIVYVGSPTGFEAKWIPQKGIPFIPISSGAVKNQNVFRVIKTVGRVFLSIFKCLKILIREKPDAVIGVGGYVSVPTCIAAFLLRIPLFLQEQNTSVGIANRFLGRLSTKIFLGFPQAQSYFQEKKCVNTGNPIRKDFFDPTFPQYDPRGDFLLVMGGSQGALAINDAMVEVLPRLKDKYPRLQIWHQTGVKDRDRVAAHYEKIFPGQSSVTAFIENVSQAYGKASLVVARSGALTVSELIQVGRPAVFVPYPRKGQNDQTTNANYLKSNGAAEVVEQGPNFVARFWETLNRTLERNRLDAMANQFSRLRAGNALATIGGLVEDAIAKRPLQA